MSPRLQRLLAAAVLATAVAVPAVALAAHDGGRAAPSSSFKGSSTGGGPASSFTGSGTAGGGDGGGGDGGLGSDDSGSGDGGLAVVSSGPGGALSRMTVQAVRQLQTDLAQLGYFHHAVTGYYGVVTTAAVKRFQRAAGLKADGIWGSRSAAALRQRLSG